MVTMATNMTTNGSFLKYSSKDPPGISICLGIIPKVLFYSAPSDMLNYQILYYILHQRSNIGTLMFEA